MFDEPVTPTPSVSPGAARGPMRLSGRRRLLFVLILCCVQLLVLAIGLEVLARLVLANPFAVQGDLVGMLQNAEEEHALRTVPGWEGSMTVERRTVPIRLNSLGLRSPEVPPRRPGDLRVLCLGDSFVFGYGVAAEEAFPAVLGERLAERLGKPVVVGNAGVPGYGTADQAACLSRLQSSFDPDLVVSTIYLGNDFMDDRVVSRYAADGFLISGDWAGLLRGSLRARLALRSRALMWLELELMETGSSWALQPGLKQQASLSGFPTHKPDFGLFMDVIDERHSWDPRITLPVVPRVLSRLESSLTRISREAGKATTLVVIMPSFWHVDDKARLAQMLSAGFDPQDYRLGLTQERIQNLCGRLGLPVLDITPFARQLDDPAALFLEQDRHLNPEGHRFVAGLITDRISALIE